MIRSSLVVLALGTAAPAAAAPAPPSLARELAACQKLGGTEPAFPVATDYPGGLSTKGNALTPATVPGATTVSPKTTACLIEAMGSELLVVQPMDDKQGIEDAYSLAGIGMAREFTAQEAATVKTVFDQVLGTRRDRPILVYCHHTSCFLSYNAILRLREHGYTQLLWMREGTKGWKAAGLPVGLTRKIIHERYPDEMPRRLDRDRLSGDGNYPTPADWYSRAREAPVAAAGLKSSSLCFEVKRREEVDDVEWDRQFFTYHTMLFKAAGVDVAIDNEVAIRRKMKKLLARVGTQIDCHDSVAQPRSLLKHVVELEHTELLEELIAWGAPLNDVDRSDGRTVLDYAEARWNRATESQKDRAERHFKMLRKAGALRLDELVAAGKWKRLEVLQAEAIVSHEAAAVKGDISSMQHLAHIYRRGVGVPANIAEANRWWQKSGERALQLRDGERIAFVGLGYWRGFVDNGCMATCDDQKALAWFKKAADVGSTSGLLYLGRAHYSGQGVKQDLQHAIKYFERVLTKDSFLGCLWLGRAYDKLGNYTKAAWYLRRVGDLNDVRGMLLGDWYRAVGLSACGPAYPDNKRWNCGGQAKDVLGK